MLQIMHFDLFWNGNKSLFVKLCLFWCQKLWHQILIELTKILQTRVFKLHKHASQQHNSAKYSTVMYQVIKCNNMRNKILEKFSAAIPNNNVLKTMNYYRQN